MNDRGERRIVESSLVLSESLHYPVASAETSESDWRLFIINPRAAVRYLENMMDGFRFDTPIPPHSIFQQSSSAYQYLSAQKALLFFPGLFDIWPCVYNKENMSALSVMTIDSSRVVRVKKNGKFSFDSWQRDENIIFDCTRQMLSIRLLLLTNEICAVIVWFPSFQSPDRDDSPN